MVNHGGNALFIDERTTGINLIIRIFGRDTQWDRMVSPVQKICAGSMAPDAYFIDLTSIEKMVFTFPVDTPLGVSGMADALGRDKVIGWPVRIRLVFLS